MQRRAPLLVITGLLLAGVFIQPGDLPTAGICLFKRLFLVDCPGCGLTRAFLSIPRGHWVEAIRFNAASPVLYGLFLLAWLKLALRMTNPSVLAVVERCNNIMAPAAVMILSGQWLWRMSAYCSAHSFSGYLAELGGGPRELVARAWLFQVLALL